MEEKQAVSVIQQIEKWRQSAPVAYEVEKLQLIDHQLQGFHQWTNGKTLLAGYRVGKLGEDSYFLLFIDWHRNQNYYLVIYLPDKSTTVCELHRTAVQEDGTELIWRYIPLKRDGQNELRKAYFQQIFGSTTVHIPLPQSSTETEEFVNQLFTLSRNRLKADRAVDIYKI